MAWSPATTPCWDPGGDGCARRIRSSTGKATAPCWRSPAHGARFLARSRSSTALPANPTTGRRGCAFGSASTPATRYGKPTNSSARLCTTPRRCPATRSGVDPRIQRGARPGGRESRHALPRGRRSGAERDRRVAPTLRCRPVSHSRLTDRRARGDLRRALDGVGHIPAV